MEQVLAEGVAVHEGLVAAVGEVQLLLLVVALLVVVLFHHRMVSPLPSLHGAHASLPTMHRVNSSPTLPVPTSATLRAAHLVTAVAMPWDGMCARHLVTLWFLRVACPLVPTGAHRGAVAQVVLLVVHWEVVVVLVHRVERVMGSWGAVGVVLSGGAQGAPLGPHRVGPMHHMHPNMHHHVVVVVVWVVGLVMDRQQVTGGIGRAPCPPLCMYPPQAL